MESSGNNRYELLFMDEEGGAATAPTSADPTEAPVKKNPAAAPVKKPQTTNTTNTAPKKPNPNSEKENKAGTLNKNDGAGGKKGPAGAGAPQPLAKGSRQNQLNGGAPGAGPVKRRPADGGFSRPPQNAGGSGGGGGGIANSGAPSEQRNNRRNFRESGGGGGGGGGEFGGNDQQRPPRQFRDRENRGPPRNRFGDNNFRGGKREFDRQSGSDKTGVKSIDKRDGAGAHNWGSVKQDIDDINKSTNEADATLTDKDESSNEQAAEQVVAPEEEETKEMTLDEWKAMREQRNKPQYNLRKAGEGEDTSQWKKMVVLNKKKEGDSEEEFEYDPSMYPQRVGRLQRIVDIQFNFNDGRRGGGSGFGRGRGRGGPGRPGGDRPGRFDGERGPGGGGRFDGERGGGGGGRFDGERGGGGGGRFDGERGGGGGRFDGERERVGGERGGHRGENKYVAPGKPRNFGDKQRSGPSSLKVDDERQFPTLS